MIYISMKGWMQLLTIYPKILEYQMDLQIPISKVKFQSKMNHQNIRDAKVLWFKEVQLIIQD